MGPSFVHLAGHCTPSKADETEQQQQQQQRQLAHSLMDTSWHGDAFSMEDFSPNLSKWKNFLTCCAASWGMAAHGVAAEVG